MEGGENMRAVTVGDLAKEMLEVDAMRSCLEHLTAGREDTQSVYVPAMTLNEILGMLDDYQEIVKALKLEF